MKKFSYTSDENSLKKNYIRYKRAKELGFLFWRRPSFKVPKQMELNSKRLVLKIPYTEKGIKYAFLDIFLDDVYCLRQLASENIKTILDVGANVGFFCLSARNIFPESTIHAYEPNTGLAEYLGHQVDFSNSEGFYEAIGNTEKMISLEFGEDSVHTRALETDNVEGNIPQVAFSKVLERMGGHIDLVKMDCEGGEWEILTDIESWKNVDRLTMEYHLFDEHTSHSDILDALEKINFEVLLQNKLDGNGMLYAERKDVLHRE